MKMKRNVLNLSLGLLSAFLFFSCLDDDDDVYVSYGVVQNFNSASNYEILTDKGNTLVVNKSYTAETLENDKRVLVNYEILSDKGKNIYEVRVNGFYNLLSKPLIKESFILQDEEARRDSIGNDPFSHIYAVFGGNFINIDFEVWHLQDSNEKHMINLVYDDTQANADTIYLTLYHNAYGEVPGKDLSLYRGAGRSSFKISDLLPEGVSAKPVKLTWTQYGANYEPLVYSDSGTFKLGNTSGTNESLLRNIGFDSSIVVK
ncbi:MAG: hypothetical protein LBV74_13625 [Tannerella sp.]|jgi:hypothetical protein|nr:hypothetical protein [Tannerella sp.]